MTKYLIVEKYCNNIPMYSLGVLAKSRKDLELLLSFQNIRYCDIHSLVEEVN